jgi:hypothetical protein
VSARPSPAESLGTKLRRLARIAERNNPIERPPMVRPAPWAPSTAYTQGTVVSNGGFWYVCVTSGTSAATGGPATTATGDATADGTAAWTLLGAPELTADDPLAPTYSFVSSNPGTQTWNPALFPGNFRCYGGYPVSGAGNSWVPRVFADGPSTFATGHGVGFGFMSDAPVCSVVYGSTTPGLGVVIDGRFYTTGANPVVSGTQWLKFDWSAAGGRRERRYTVYGGMSTSFSRA